MHGRGEVKSCLQTQVGHSGHASYLEARVGNNSVPGILPVLINVRRHRIRMRCSVEIRDSIWEY
jgi:hypothetical protein